MKQQSFNSFNSFNCKTNVKLKKVENKTNKAHNGQLWYLKNNLFGGVNSTKPLFLEQHDHLLDTPFVPLISVLPYSQFVPRFLLSLWPPLTQQWPPLMWATPISSRSTSKSFAIPIPSLRCPVSH